MAFPASDLETTIEFALSSTALAPPYWEWVDMSGRVANQGSIPRIPIRRGRPDESSNTQPSSMSVRLRNLDGALTPADPRSQYYPNLHRGTPVRALAEGARRALRLPGRFNSFASTPAHTDFAFAADFDIRIEIEPEQWTSATLDNSATLYEYQPIIGQWPAAGGQPAWMLLMEGPGRLAFAYSPNGVGWFTKRNLDGDQIAALKPISIGVTFEANDGNGNNRVTWYRSDDAAPPADILLWDKLGDALTGGGLSVFAGSSEPIRIGALEDNQESSLRARVFKAEIRDGINGTLRAAPNFEAQPEGTTSFDDSTGKTWTLAAAAGIDSKRTIYAGEIASFRPEWPNGDDRHTTPATDPSESQVPFEIAGILRRLQQGAKPLRSSLYRHVTSSEFAGRIVGYWPCEEVDGADRFSTPIDGQQSGLIADKVALAAESTFPAADALPRIDSGETGSWRAPVTGGGDTAWGVDFYARIKTPETAPAATTLVIIETAGTAKFWRFSINSTTFVLTVTDAAGNVLSTTTAGISLDFDSWFLFHIDAEQVGAAISFTITVVSVDTGAGGGLTQTFSGTLGRVTAIGNETAGPPDGLAFGHYIVHDRTLTVGWTAGADTAWVGETAAHRFHRLCIEQGIDAEIVGDPTSVQGRRGTTGLSASMGRQGRSTFVELLNECVKIDRGVMFERRAVPGLVYRTGQNLYSQNPQLTIDASAEQLRPPFEPAHDDQRTANDVEVSAATGSSDRVIDQPHIDAEGLYDIAPTINGVGGVRIQEAILGAQNGLAAEVQNQNLHHAAWLLHLGTWPDMRYPTVSVDFGVSPELLEAWHELALGDRVTVENLPIQHPRGTIDLLVEATSETLSPSDWKAAITCSPGGPFNIPELPALPAAAGAVSDARLDAVATFVTDEIGAADTTVAISATDWSTESNDYPLRLELGGEIIEAAGISGAGTQTLTGVTRSINGVVRTHPALTEIRMADPHYLALGYGTYQEEVLASSSTLTTIYQSDFSDPGDLADFLLYDGAPGTQNGNNDWGARRASAVQIRPHPTEGNVLTITAENGAGLDAGLLVHGGAKLRGRSGGQDYKFRYGVVKIRARVDVDPAEVTSGLALLWQADTPTVKGPEINIFENFRNRDTRTPIDSFNHWGENGEFVFGPVPQIGLSTADWHDYVLVWEPGLVTVSVDGRVPEVLATDPAEITQEDMELVFQLDAWPDPSIVTPNPATPAHQPQVSGPLVLEVSSFQVDAQEFPQLPTPALTYPNPGALINVAAGDDLQAVIDASSPGDHIVVAAGDFTDDADTLDISHRIHLEGAGPGLTKLPRVQLIGALDGVWLTGFTVERTTPVTSNSFVGIKNTTAALTNFLIRDIEITGHGLSDGLELNRRYDNDRGVIHNVEVHDIENHAFVLYADNLRTWGLVAHDLYRTVDQSFFDVDAVNFGGSNQVHSGFWFYGIHEDDSVHRGEDNGSGGVIPASSGRANPTGPVGTASMPHVDGFQTFEKLKADNVTPWFTRDIFFLDGTIDYRPAAGNVGSGARQGGIMQNNETDGVYLAGDITWHGCRIASVGTSLLLASGVDNFTVDECDLWIVQPHDDPIRTTFAAIGFVAGPGTGPATNPGAQVTNNNIYRKTASQPLYSGSGTAPAITESNNTIVTGDYPTVTDFTAPTVHRPTEAEVQQWLSA